MASRTANSRGAAQWGTERPRALSLPLPHTLPMPLYGDELTDFIQAYENAFNERITAAQANELYLRLLQLYASIKRVADETPPTTDPSAPPAADIQM